MLDDFLAIFSLEKIRILLCDREFIGTEWIKALFERGVPFCLRVRENMKFYCPKGKCINKSIRRLNRGCRLILKGKYRIGDKAGIQAEDVSIVI